MCDKFSIPRDTLKIKPSFIKIGWTIAALLAGRKVRTSTLRRISVGERGNG